MFKIIIMLMVVVISGCATVAPPVSTETADNLTKGRTAIAFYDFNKKINYLEDIYLVLAVAQTASNSSYNGIWDSDKDLTKLHKKELDKLGLHTVSIHNLFSKKEIDQINKYNIESLASSSMEDSVLTAEIKNILMKKNIDHLFLVDWSGYTLHIQTLGLPARGSTTMRFRLFNTQKGNVIWHGTFLLASEPDLGDKTGKELLEKNNMRGYKAEVKKMILTRYEKASDDNVAKLIGIINTDKSGR